MPNYEVDQGRE